MSISKRMLGAALAALALACAGDGSAPEETGASAAVRVRFEPEPLDPDGIIVSLRRETAEEAFVSVRVTRDSTFTVRDLPPGVLVVDLGDNTVNCELTSSRGELQVLDETERFEVDVTATCSRTGAVEVVYDVLGPYRSYPGGRDGFVPYVLEVLDTRIAAYAGGFLYGPYLVRNLPVGEVQVRTELVDYADHCTAPASESITIALATVTQLRVPITCIDNFGRADVLVSGSGSGAPTSAVVRIDTEGLADWSVEVGKTRQAFGLDAGVRTFTLTGLPPNCAAVGPATQAVEVGPSIPAPTVNFAFSCS